LAVPRAPLDEDTDEEIDAEVPEREFVPVLRRRAAVLAPTVSVAAVAEDLDTAVAVLDGLEETRAFFVETMARTIEEYKSSPEVTSRGVCEPRIPEPSVYWCPVAGGVVVDASQECPTGSQADASRGPVPCELYPELLHLAQELTFPDRISVVETRLLLLAPAFANRSPSRPNLREASIYRRTRKEMMSTTLFGNIFHPGNLSDISRYAFSQDLCFFLYLSILAQLFDPRSPARSGAPVANRRAFLHADSPWWGFVISFTDRWRNNTDSWCLLLEEIARRHASVLERAKSMIQFFSDGRPSIVFFDELSEFLQASRRLAGQPAGAALHVAREQFIEWIFGTAKHTIGHEPPLDELLLKLYNATIAK